MFSEMLGEERAEGGTETNSGEHAVSVHIMAILINVYGEERRDNISNIKNKRLKRKILNRLNGLDLMDFHNNYNRGTLLDNF